MPTVVHACVRTYNHTALFDDERVAGTTLSYPTPRAEETLPRSLPGWYVYVSNRFTLETIHLQGQPARVTQKVHTP